MRERETKEDSYTCLFKKSLIRVQLLYNVLVSAAEQSESTIRVHVFPPS